MQRVILLKEKILFAINALWSAIIAFSFPACLGIIYATITGHSKGYDYDLGAEKDVAVLFGVVMLIIWLILAIPSNVYILNRLVKKNKWLLFVYLIIFLILSGGCILILGGWSEYIKAFGV